MEQTANLQLPYIMPSQAQKHVTHNEAVRSLDTLVQPAVQDRHLSVPPAVPAEGARYLVAAGGTGAWAGRDGKIATWQDGAWAYFTPRAGWLLWVADEERLIGFDGIAWRDAAVHSVNPAPLVGVNSTADATNRLSVKSPASLFDAETDDHRLKINKAAAGSAAMLVFQSGYSGRAEFGLAGDDDWRVKVSADGIVWTEALQVDRATGRVRLPAALPLSDENQVVAGRHVREKLAANRTYFVRTDGSDSNTGLANSSAGAFLTVQKAINVVAALDISIHDVTIQVANGTYSAGATVTGPWLGSGSVSVVGNATTPANVNLNVTGNCIVVQTGARLKVSGLKLQCGGIGLWATAQGQIEVVGLMEFSACSSYHAFADAGGRVRFSANWNTTGGAFASLGGQSGGIVDIATRSTAITGAPAWGSAYASFSLNALLIANGFTFSGSATGARYGASTGGGIATFGGGANHFPGNSAGTATSPGWYA